MAVIDEESVGSGDQFAAIEAVTLAFSGADNLAAVEAVVDEVVLLSHAVTLHPFKEDFFVLGVAVFALGGHKQRL